MTAAMRNRVELGWRLLNGGLTLITLLLRGAQFVDGIYGPEDVTSADMGLSAAEQRDPG